MSVGRNAAVTQLKPGSSVHQLTACFSFASVGYLVYKYTHYLNHHREFVDVKIIDIYTNTAGNNSTSNLSLKNES